MNDTTVQVTKICCKCHAAPRASGSYCNPCERARRKEPRPERCPPELVSKCWRCGLPSRKRRLCNACHAAAEKKRSREAGTPERDNRTAPERFRDFFTQGSGDECWEWRGALRRTSGYGAFCVSNRNIGAHVYSWTLATGRVVPRGMVICHTCDNRKCVNAAHLFLGTYLDNTRDMIAKGRAAFQKRRDQS